MRMCVLVDVFVGGAASLESVIAVSNSFLLLQIQFQIANHSQFVSALATMLPPNARGRIRYFALLRARERPISAICSRDSLIHTTGPNRRGIKIAGLISPIS